MKFPSRTWQECKVEVERVLSAAKAIGFDIRLVGGVAVRWSCLKYDRLFEEQNRTYGDIDFICLQKDFGKAKNFFVERGYTIDQKVLIFSDGKRLVLENYITKWKIDLFFEELDFCHRLNIKKRFFLSFPTISASDLLLSKLQIMELTKKDILDISLLLATHELHDNDDSGINLNYLKKILADDWGFYHSVTQNLTIIKQSTTDLYIRTDLYKKIEQLYSSLESFPKTGKWKVRSLIGERIKWFNDVSDMDR